MKKIILTALLFTVSMVYLSAQPRTVSVRFTSTPSGAAVKLQTNSTVLGTTPFTATLSLNRVYAVVFVMDGYASYPLEFRAGEGPVNVTLRSISSSESSSFSSYSSSSSSFSSSSSVNTNTKNPNNNNNNNNNNNYTVPTNRWQESDYSNWNHTNYRNNPLFQETIDFNNIDYRRIAATVFYATNEIRQRHNLSIFDYARELEISAYNHSKEMTLRNFFDHSNPHNPSRRTTGDRARLAGITNPYLAENIAQSFAIQYQAGRSVYGIDGNNGLISYTSGGTPIPPHTYLTFADAVLNQWMNSPGHRANILNTNGLQLGCGVYLFRKQSFFNVPYFNATQNFQWYHRIVPGQATDRLE